MTITLPPTVNALGWSLVHFLWQGLLIATLLEVVLAGMRGRSSAARYVVRCIALGAMGLAPIVTFLALVGADSAPLAFEPALAAFLPALEPTSSGMERALPWIVLVWSLGATLLGARLWIGCRRVGRLRAHDRGRELPPDTLETFERVAQRLGVRAVACVVDSVRLAAPAVVGWLRPVVLFPAHVLTGLSPEQIECLIVHELAHVRRHDFLVNVLQSVVEAALFYHPAVWWVSAGIRTEREFCCDDVALRLTRNGVSYARALTTLEAWRGAADLEVGVSTLGGSLMQRIQRLIDTPEVTSRSRGGIAVHALLPFLAAGTIGMTALAWTADEPEPQSEPQSEPQLVLQSEPRPDREAEPASPTEDPQDPWRNVVWDIEVTELAELQLVAEPAPPAADDIAARVRAIRASIRALSRDAENAALSKELEGLEKRLSREIDRFLERREKGGGRSANPFIQSRTTKRPRVDEFEALAETWEAYAPDVQTWKEFDTFRAKESDGARTWLVEKPTGKKGESSAPRPSPAPHKMTWTVEWTNVAPSPQGGNWVWEVTPEPTATWKVDPQTKPDELFQYEWRTDRPAEQFAPPKKRSDKGPELWISSTPKEGASPWITRMPDSGAWLSTETWPERSAAPSQDPSGEPFRAWLFFDREGEPEEESEAPPEEKKTDDSPFIF